MFLAYNPEDYIFSCIISWMPVQVQVWNGKEKFWSISFCDDFALIENNFFFLNNLKKKKWNQNRKILELFINHLTKLICIFQILHVFCFFLHILFPNISDNYTANNQSNPCMIIKISMIKNWLTKYSKKLYLKRKCILCEIMRLHASTNDLNICL